MARWLDDLIGKIFAIEGVDQTQVGRLDFKEGTGVSYTANVVEGAEGEPTTLELTITAGAGAGNTLETQVDSALDSTIERINFVGGEGVTLEGAVDGGDPNTLTLTVNTGPSGSTTTSSVSSGSTGSRDDFVPGGDTAAWGAASHWTTGPGSLSISGLAAPSSTQPHLRTIRVWSPSSPENGLTITTEDANSTAANRFVGPADESSVFLAHGSLWGTWYDDTISRWRLLGAIADPGAPQVVEVTPSTNQVDYAPGGAAVWDKATMVLIENSGDIQINGFAAPLYPSSPHTKRIYKTGPAGSTITIPHNYGQTGASSAANRVLVPGEVSDVLDLENGFRLLDYDTENSRWRVSGGRSLTREFDTNADMRAAVTSPVAGAVYRTRGQDTAGDSHGGTWVGVSGSPGTYTHDGLTMIVPSGGDGSLGLLRVSGTFLTPSVADDSVISWHVQNSHTTTGGFISVAPNVHDTPFPAIGGNGIADYDAGNSPSTSEVFARPNFDAVGGGAAPTGTTGADGQITLFVRTGIMHIENRFGSAMPFKVNMFV